MANMKWRGRIRKFVILVSCLTALVIGSWELVNPRFLLALDISMDWDQARGFKTFSSAYRPGIARFFDPLIAPQAKPRIAAELRRGGWESVHGRASVWICCWVVVLGVDRNRDWRIIDPEITPLMEAAKLGDVPRVRKLLAEGAEINKQDQRGWTALMYASRGYVPDSSQVVKVLLQTGAAPDLKDRLGRTALFWAASECQPQSVRLLLGAGADVNVRTNEGRSALGDTPSDCIEVKQYLAGGPALKQPQH